MSKWSSNIRSAFNRAFPERQIYHRSGGTVRYISISPWQQAIMASGLIALGTWTLFATGSYIMSGGAGIGTADQRELAKYERWVQELRAKDALSRSLLAERTNEFEKTYVEFEEKTEVLTTLLKSLDGEEEIEITALKGDGSALLVRASIEEADTRQPREALAVEASVTAVGTKAKIRQLSQEHAKVLDEAENIAVERAEQARGVLQLTGVDNSRVGENREMGGPLVQYASLGVANASTPEEAAFRQRVAHVAARIEEKRHYENIVKSLPLAEPVGVQARLTSNYGLRVDPFNKRPGWHNGIDIAAYNKAPIVAAGPGKIVFAGTKSGYGRVVDVEHGNGFKSRYAHLRSISVKKGDTVATGDEVGRMGSSGRSTGPHLHYEVWFYGKPYDPVKFLKAGKHVHQD